MQRYFTFVRKAVTARMSCMLLLIMAFSLTSRAQTDFSTSDYSFVAATGTLTVLTDAGSTNWKTTNLGNFTASHLRKVVITNTVSDIGTNAFENCSGITELDLTAASNLTMIGNHAFRATSITGTLTIPSGVSYIGANAFVNCYTITALDLTAVSNLKIESNAFSGTGISGTLTIPAGVNSIGVFAFFNCPDITALDLTAASNLKIGAYAFIETGITGTLTIPAGVNEIGGHVFDNCSGITAFVFTGMTAPAILNNITNISAPSYYPAGATGYDVASIPKPAYTYSGASPVKPTITTTNLLAGTVGTIYSQVLDATGDGAFIWSIESGALPNGLSLSTDGSISGIPSTSGIFSFTVKARNGILPDDTKSFSITVNPATLVDPPVAPRITGQTSLKLTAGYKATSTNSYTITGTAPVSVKKTAGDDRITWNSSTCCLDISEGLPTGVYKVELTASNAVSSVRFTFTLTVEARVYYLDVARSYLGGSVTSLTHNANPYLSEEGQPVTLTITPDEGYALETIHVYLYGTNTPIPIDGTDLTRTFTMPAHHISVAAVFSQTGKVSIVETDNYPSLSAYVQNGVLYVSGLTAGTVWNVYNIQGNLIYQSDNTTLTGFQTLLGFRLPGRGIYLVTDGKSVVKIIH